MDSLLQALCFCVAIANPAPQLSQRAGDIWYTHERLHHGRHLLRLSTADFIVDSNAFRADRLAAFAERFAGETCQGRYKLAATDRASWPNIRPRYARQFVFHCG
jgi:hypothetical protein